MKFLGSAGCQNIVADNAVVFPALTSATERVLAAHEKAGREVQLFLDQAKAANQQVNALFTGS